MDRLYRAGDDFGYSLGLAGGVLVLSLALYSLRKRRILPAALGTVRQWFWRHIVIGTSATIMMTLHSTCRCSSTVDCVALASMMIIAVSGIAGVLGRRYLHGWLTDTRAPMNRLELRRRLLTGLHAVHVSVTTLFVVTSLVHIMAVHMY